MHFHIGNTKNLTSLYISALLKYINANTVEGELFKKIKWDHKKYRTTPELKTNLKHDRKKPIKKK